MGLLHRTRRALLRRAGGNLPFADTFTRANGAIGSPWESGGATWTIVGNEAINTPTEGAELVTNGTMEADANWTSYGTPTTNARSNEQAHGGTFSRKVVADADVEGIYSDAFTTSTGGWYVASFWVWPVTVNAVRMYVARGAGGGWAYEGSTGGLNLGAWNEIIFIYREAAGGAGAYLFLSSFNANTLYFDDASTKPLTLNTLLTDVATSRRNVIATVELDVITTRTQAGVVLNLDDAITPANFVIGYHNMTNAILDKCVAGTYTNLINAAAAYGAGRNIQVRKSGTSYDLYYNAVQIGATQTVADVGIISNTRHGMFSTYSGNQFDNFTLEAN